MTDEKEEGPSSNADGDVTRFSPTPGDRSAGTTGDGDERTRLGRDADSTRLQTVPDDADKTHISRTAIDHAAASRDGKIGFVLNNIWKVRRLIAEGGMG